MRNADFKLKMERWARTHTSDGNPKISSTKGENKGKSGTFRVACSECNEQKTNPEQFVYVPVSSTAKKATCRYGHVIRISP
jgi:hypothetical protein